ncbi:MAG: iron-sulfur cluster repair di-iron protein [Bryobacteraceae bacterium]|nr:iron-sulfur cluster repair di-iron protein [Bryobacteraceae bacterium]
MQTIEKTVREIALENPSSIRVFETLGIDYCCGGKRSLSEACSLAEIDIDKTLALLEQAELDRRSGQTSEWVTRPLSELIAHIMEHHHAFVRRETERLVGMLAKISAKHGPTRPEIPQIQSLFLVMAQELSTHLLKEEQVLFPHIERLEKAAESGAPAPVAFFGSVAGPISNMAAEHDDAGAILAQLRELSNGYTPPEGACPTFVGLYSGLEDFEHDLHQHVHLENNILFPRATELERARQARS